MNFFVQRELDELERRWDHLMWEEYLIKRHINYSRKEIYAMPAEERKWIMDRVQEEAERIKQANSRGNIKP